MTTQHTISVTNADIIAAAIGASSHKRGFPRGSFPRFMFDCGEEGTTMLATVANLERELGTIRLGETVWVFRNAGRGATITTEKPSFADLGWS